MNESTTSTCACPDCKCQVTQGHRVSKNGKEYCSQACADGHKSGEGCCDGACHCHG